MSADAECRRLRSECLEPYSRSPSGRVRGRRVCCAAWKECLVTRCRICLVAVGLTLAAIRVEAGSVTYEFIEANALAGASAVAYVEFSSPASGTEGWSTSNASIEVLSFTIADRFLGAVGPYTPTITREVVSLTGATLNSGTITATNGTFDATAVFSAGPFPSTLEVAPRFGSASDQKSVYGKWVFLDPSVPEPSSAILGTTAAILGLALWSRRRSRPEKVTRTG